MSQLKKPFGVFVSNGEVFIADTYNHRVRKILRNGQIVTIAGTGRKGYNGDGRLATDAELQYPYSVCVSSSDQVYFSELYGHRIRKIDRNGIISTIAGTGAIGYSGDGQLAVDAKLSHPYGLFVTDDEQVLIADSCNGRVRKIDRNGIISTIAGDGTNASLDYPTSVFQYKNEIYIVDSNTCRIRKVDQNGIISTIAEKIYTQSLFVHHSEVYFTDGSGLLCNILPNGNIKTIAGIVNEEGFNGDDRLLPLNVNLMDQTEFSLMMTHRFTLLIHVIIVLEELIRME